MWWDWCHIPRHLASAIGAIIHGDKLPRSIRWYPKYNFHLEIRHLWIWDDGKACDPIKYTSLHAISKYIISSNGAWGIKSNFQCIFFLNLHYILKEIVKFNNTHISHYHMYKTFVHGLRNRTIMIYMIQRNMLRTFFKWFLKGIFGGLEFLGYFPMGGSLVIRLNLCEIC
jgi:hypothetical protein